MIRRLHLLRALIASALLGSAGTGFAQSADPVGDLSFTASIAGVSDYRFRGVSLSGEEPAVQGSLEVGLLSGFYGGVWASSLGDSGAGDLEVDVYGGWAKEFGLASVDVGVLGYVYPDGSNLDYYEVYGSFGFDIGPASATVGANYAPDQRNVGSDDNLYIYGDLSAGIPLTPFTFRAHVGHEKGGFGGPDGDKLDWSLGAEYIIGPVALGLAYVDTDIRGLDEADAGVVLSLSATF